MIQILPILPMTVLVLLSLLSPVVGQNTATSTKHDTHVHQPMHMVKAHKFPLVDEYNNQIANEFQVLRMHRTKHIADIISKKVITTIEPSHPLLSFNQKLDSTSYTYQITNVSPLEISNDEIISVSYHSSHPSSSDWIAAYAPLNLSLLTYTVPVKYGWCDEDSNYLTSGYGTLKFNMTNLRSTVGFVYYTNSLSHPVYVTSSTEIVSFTNINQPLRPRVVATGNPDVLNLLWSSATSTTPVMKWGTSSGQYTQTITAITTTIPQSSMCGGPANSTGWRDIGLIHTASFEGMKALATMKVYYIFGDRTTDDFSSEYILHVPPLAGYQENNRPTKVILFDDLGRGSTDMTYTWNEYGRPSIYTAMSVGAEVLAGNVDAIYHGGDISYATGYEAVWDFFLDMISPMASGTIYLTTVGNHESDWPNTASYYTGTDSGGECGVMSTTLLPQPYPSVTNKPWWSYDVGLIHFIGLSTEHDYTIGSEQYTWLESDLMNVNRTESPWIIFGGHRAMYVNSDYGGAVSSDITVMDNMIKNLEPLLWQYQVNLGFYGHNHVVNRNAAVLNQTVIQHAVRTKINGETVWYHDNPQATVQMVVGTGGASFTYNAVNPPPDWNEYYFYQWGYARVTAMNAHYLDWQWVNAETGQIIDHMVITQANPLVSWNISDTTTYETFPNDDDNSSDNNNMLSNTKIILISVFGFIGIGIITLAFIYYNRKSSLFRRDPMASNLIVTNTRNKSVTDQQTRLETVNPV